MVSVLHVLTVQTVLSHMLCTVQDGHRKCHCGPPDRHGCTVPCRTHTHLADHTVNVLAQTKADFLAGPQRPATPCGSPTASIPLPPPMPQGIKPPPATTVAVAEGAVDLGVPTDGSAGFVWDNEGPESPSATEVRRFARFSRVRALICKQVAL